MTMVCLVSLIGVWFGVLSFVLNRSHLLSALLSLEWVVLCVYSSMVSQFMIGCLDGGFCLYFLGVGACEGALGLSLVVSIARSHGSDKFVGLNTIQC